MAGGEGTRLRPMTANQPKPLLPVVNKPIMEHVLRLLKRHGFAETVVTVQFLAALVTIGLKRVPNPLEFGIIIIDDDGRVQRFLEKPTWGQVFSDTANTGIYVMEPEVLDHVA